MANCEMCGKDTGLLTADIEGVELKVCSECAKYGIIKREVVRKIKPPFNHNFSTNKENRVFKVVDNFSYLVKSARENKGMKQEDFSKLLNERESLVSKWELGLLNPSVDTARRIGRVLGLRLVEEEKEGVVDLEFKRKSDEFTLGDFIKVRRRG